MKKFNDILFKWYSKSCVHLFDLFCRTWFDRNVATRHNIAITSSLFYSILAR